MSNDQKKEEWRSGIADFPWWFKIPATLICWIVFPFILLDHDVRYDSELFDDYIMIMFLGGILFGSVLLFFIKIFAPEYELLAVPLAFWAPQGALFLFRKRKKRQLLQKFSEPEQ